jgi:hypothetical protein
MIRLAEHIPLDTLQTESHLQPTQFSNAGNQYTPNNILVHWRCKMALICGPDRNINTIPPSSSSATKPQYHEIQNHLFPDKNN